jgi:hypothetical protein
MRQSRKKKNQIKAFSGEVSKGWEIGSSTEESGNFVENILNQRRNIRRKREQWSKIIIRGVLIAWIRRIVWETQGLKKKKKKKIN